MTVSPDFAEQRRRLQQLAATPCTCDDQGDCVTCRARTLDAQMDVALYELVGASKVLLRSVRETRRLRALLWLVTKYVMLRSRVRSALRLGPAGRG